MSTAQGLFEVGVAVSSWLHKAGYYLLLISFGAKLLRYQLAKLNRDARIAMRESKRLFRSFKHIVRR